MASKPLQSAAWNNHVDAVAWLLAHGANLNRELLQLLGRTPLRRVQRSHRPRQAIDCPGAEVNAKPLNGSTPLMMAAREGREDLAKVLLNRAPTRRPKTIGVTMPRTLAMRYDHYRLGKMIASPEEFAIAVKAPKETFGEAVKSAAVPSEIEQLLRQIREAEAEKQPTDELRKKLMVAIENFRRSLGDYRQFPAPGPAALPATLDRDHRQTWLTRRRAGAGSGRRPGRDTCQEFARQHHHQAEPTVAPRPVRSQS